MSISPPASGGGKDLGGQQADCHHDDVFNGVCVWCRAEVGSAPTDEQARIVGDLLGVTLTRHTCLTDPACCDVCETHNGCRCDDVRYV